MPTAHELMATFSARTARTSEHPARRYLWTDAFAVCTYLGLGLLERARQLVDEVHRVLGHHRSGELLGGWLSGLDDARRRLRPTEGGLRIGTPLPERGPGEPIDDRLERERDGQYFHYLTKWMHALDQVARVTGEARYHAWARELAVVAHQRFTYGPLGRRRMYWKMSVELGRPQVTSMGHHDPLDGLVTCLELDATAEALAARHRRLPLEDAIDDFRAMIEPGGLVTSDLLGVGGLLVDASRLAQLHARRPSRVIASLAEAVRRAAVVGLEGAASALDLRRDPEQRVALGELGLAIGLAAVSRPGAPHADRFTRYAPIGEDIVTRWCSPEARQTRAWLDHADLNDVMLATALAPDGFVVLHGLA